jgi:choline kinase
MDTVILAAGRGSRLDGIAAPYHKPLMVINGQALIVQLVQISLQATPGDIIIVAAPENTLPLCQLLNARFPRESRLRVVVQTSPSGPGDALLLGLELAGTDEVLVLMGDNVTTFSDIRRIVDEPGNMAIGIQALAVEEVERFTRMRQRPGGGTEWVEKVPATLDADGIEHGMALAWVGPFKAPTREFETALLTLQSREAERPIGPAFNCFPNARAVAVHSIDIGVPEALA